MTSRSLEPRAPLHDEMAEAAEAEAKLGDCCRTLGKEGEEEEEEEENVEQQRTELEMLQSIYSNEIIIVKENTEFLASIDMM